jgi:raffinose/stachyose/melibiose transport system substrate-binding protein
MKFQGKNIFALVILAVLLVSCNKKEGKKVTVKALAYGDISNADGQSWKRIVSAFETANPDIDIDDTLLYEDLFHQKVTDSLATGDIPDIAYMGADVRWGKPWQDAGQQIDMTPYIDPDKYDLSLIPEMGPHGERYYIPLGTSNMCSVIFENTKLLKDLGFETPVSYNDMVKMVKPAQEKGIEVLLTHGAESWVWGSCVISAFIARTSGDTGWIGKASKGEKKFTDPEFISALSLIRKMIDDGVLSSKTDQTDSTAGLLNYNSGKCIFYLSGQWDAGNISADVQSVTKLIAFPILPGETGCAGSVAAAWQVGYGLTKKGASDEKVRKAAMKFFDFFNSEQEVTQRLRDGLIVAPILKGYQIPADMPSIIAEKIRLGTTAQMTDVIDSYLSEKPNDALMAGCQQIADKVVTSEQVAALIQSQM